ncbi:hypothetical protein ABT340_39770 [Streptosporangium sp. NPDC000239]|uniref:hypothetical protein n=1 Tax=Streptosporangium sp. NPDC000239 TaxID=3154248 RepID=UPI00331EF56F
MPSTKQQNTTTRLDWSLRPRGPISAAGQGALALAAIGGVGHYLAALPWGWAAAATVAGITGTVLAGQDRTPMALAYRLGCWLGGGAWVGWVWAYGLADPAAAGALGVGAVAAAVFSPISARTRPRPSVTGAMLGDAPIGSDVPRKQVPLAQEWVARIRRVTRVRVGIDRIEPWPGRAGFSALVLQPLGASSSQQLHNASIGLAEDARLLNGCGVEWRPGPFRGSLWMDVSTSNALAEVIPHPGIQLGGSITDPEAVRLGRYRTGATTTVGLRENTMVLAGQKRSGKSGALHNISADLAAADDSLLWQMDLNGGGISRSWLRPWLTGRTDRPAVDWAAPCKEEAVLMAHAKVAIAIDRKSAHAELKAVENVQLLPVSRRIPAIVTVLDEGKEALGQKVTDPIVRRIRALIEQAVDIGGNEACNYVLSVLRSTATALATDLLKQCTIKGTMRVSARSELDYLFDYYRGISPADAPEQGSGFLQIATDPPRTFKAFFMLPSDIETAAVQIAGHCPELDPDAVRAAGHAYATRYERMRWLFSTPEQRTRLTPPEPIELPGVTDDRGQPIVWDPAVTHPAAGDARETARSQETAMEKRRPGHLRLLRDGATSGWGDPEQVAARARAGQPRPHRASYPSEPRPRLRAEQVHEVPAEQVPVPELLTRAIAAFDGDDRIHSVTLADRLGVDQVELAELLRSVGVRTLQRAFMRGGEERRGYGLQDLEAAAAAIRSGDLQVPPEVADWPAA